MIDLLPYLPNVRSIEIKSRKGEGNVIEFVNEWRGGGDIPAAIRAVLSESVLAWTDYATWRADASYSPAMDTADRDKRMAAWHRAVDRSRAWANDE